jgi:hypothetical protein
MAEFLLLLHNEPDRLMKLGPEDMQKAVEKYLAWTKKPFYTGGKRLTPDTGRVLQAQNGKARATDGPYSESKEVLGGFYTIEAANYDEAVKLSLDHPHLEYGGTIEIRQVWVM